MRRLIDRLAAGRMLARQEFRALIEGREAPGLADYLFERARAACERFYAKDVYMRGLIEFTNYCRNDCLYCGIRRSNLQAERYRLSKDQILACCCQGYALGFRTFVLQGGEDPYFSDARMTEVVSAIHGAYPDCAITLSLGERSYASYQRLFEAGAERYLLRHETANEAHYQHMHPASMSWSQRVRCLYELKEIGYQVGCGFMVGSPGQSTECLIDELYFIKALRPQMVGIGPFIPHKATPYAAQKAGTLELTLFMLGLIRLLEARALLPATTALGTIHPQGRERGVMAGANVVMPNLSPVGVRDKYLLYDNKICTGDEAAECRHCLQNRMRNIGYNLVSARGDCAGFAANTLTGRVITDPEEQEEVYV
ncbi:MAG: [FeFe] hydrogenase H-cluster radical SAM maturase HydE [Peptococcaceae bacterium]|jgi:biotin synthase|nr:[FeFe] hydrogenase H-cluster radical SAM maturase HydE [Peptococcaceae bacterium]